MIRKQNKDMPMTCHIFVLFLDVKTDCVCVSFVDMTFVLRYCGTFAQSNTRGATETAVANERL
jgi:hypothetical protein